MSSTSDSSDLDPTLHAATGEAPTHGDDQGLDQSDVNASDRDVGQGTSGEAAPAAPSVGATAGADVTSGRPRGESTLVENFQLLSNHVLEMSKAQLLQAHSLAEFTTHVNANHSQQNDSIRHAIKFVAGRQTPWSCPPGVPRPAQFDPARIEWAVFFDRFKTYCLMANVPTPLVASQLLSCLSDPVYQLVYDAQYTTDPQVDVIERFLSDLYACKKSRQEWEAELFSLSRLQGESLRAFALRMRTITNKAQLPVSERFLADRLVSKLAPAPWVDWLHMQLQVQDSVTLDTVVALGEKLERSHLFRGDMSPSMLYKLLLRPW
jgi:hypothetical protein